MLAWADKQTISGAFGTNPAITTEGVPAVTWYHGSLEVKTSGRRITLTESAGQYRTWTNCTSAGKWTKWMQLATATPPQEFDLPLAEGIAEKVRASYCKTQEGLVVVSGWVTGAAKSSTVAVLPVGYRPQYVKQLVVPQSSDQSKNDTARIEVYQTGEIKVIMVENEAKISEGLSLCFSFFASST